MLDDRAQVCPRQPVGAEIAQAQPQPDQVECDSIAVLVDQLDDAEDSPIVTASGSLFSVS